MEVKGEELRRRMMDELSRGEALARELQRSLDSSTSSKGGASWESRDVLVKEVLSSFANARSLLKSGDGPTAWEAGLTLPPAVLDSPRSVCSSPPGDVSDKPFAEPERRDVYRKRKALPKWTEQVSVDLESATATEMPLDDGYSWRKYGQKDILGAKYPRGYYRCTHRHAQGCQATKQVQRSDHNPSVFDITYCGKHTCNQLPQLSSTFSPRQDNKQNQRAHGQFQDQQQLNFNQELPAQVTGLDEPTMASGFFSFPLTSRSHEQQQQQQQQQYQSPIDGLMGSLPLSFDTTVASDPNYYMPSTRELPRLHASESELSQIISAAMSSTSAANAPVVSINMPLEPLDFDHQDFSGFGGPSFF